MNLTLLRRRTRGFSLVELMIAVVVGLLALAFATRMIANGETNKQAALGGSDSMQNGMLGLFSIEKDAAQAGWGLNDPLIVGCDTIFHDANNFALTTADRGGLTVSPLASVVIQSNSTGSDIISINSGSSVSGTGMLQISSDYAAGASSLDVDRNPYGFTDSATNPAGGDVILVAPATRGISKCSLAQISQIIAPPSPGQNQIKIASGGANRFNAGTLGIDFGALKSRVFNLGPASTLSFHTWSASNGFLQLRATDVAGAGAAAVSVTDNIVAVKAQYGLDTRNGANFTPETGMQLTRWSNTMIDADGDGVAGGAEDYQRIAAVRIAVVARSRSPERPSAGGTCTATTTLPSIFSTTVPTGIAAVPVSVTLAVAGDSVDWKCYRYRVFESIVPLRNSGWRPTP
ncbi:MAG: PilW family protein [Pseudomonadota bacterium]|nr:PilW family protein [Pseudomonadota bacterium]